MCTTDHVVTMGHPGRRRALYRALCAWVLGSSRARCYSGSLPRTPLAALRTLEAWGRALLQVTPTMAGSAGRIGARSSSRQHPRHTG